MYPILFSCSLLRPRSLGMAMSVYFSCTLLGHTLRTLAMSGLISCSVWWHCAWFMYDGLSWLCGQPSLVMRAFDLVVWVCAQGDCHRCIFMLYCVHDHHGVIVLIHVTKWHWFPRVCDTYQHVLTLWSASTHYSASMSIHVVFTDTKPYRCAIARQTWNSAEFLLWNGASPLPYPHIKSLVRIAFGMLWHI